MQANHIIRSVRKELMHYPGVEHEIREGGKHKRMVFHKNGASRFLTIPRTPSDFRAGDNAIRDFKKTMNELGAQRLDILPGQTMKRRTRDAIAGVSLNKTVLTLHIPANSKLIDRFKTADNKAAGHWSFEVRASADLNAPPMLAVKKVKLPPGKTIMHGTTSGYFIASGGGWRVQIARTQLPALSKRVDAISAVDVELYEDNGNELVFKLPTGVIPTKFKPHKPAPKPSEAWPEVPKADARYEPVERDEQPMPAAMAAAITAALARSSEPIPALPQNLTLQFPKQAVSVEQAIMVLNKAKARLGNNLRFTITEGGLLTATHRIGH